MQLNAAAELATPLTLKRPLHVQAICANKVFAQTFWQCRVLFARLRKLLAWHQNSLIFFCASSQCLRRLSACLHKQTSVLLGVDTVWLLLFVIRSTIDHAMSSKGTAEEQQFLIEFIEEYRSLPALWCVWQVLSTATGTRKMNRTLNYWTNTRKSI